MIDGLIVNNRAWAADKVRVDPAFFTRLVAQQSPQFLWIGCADSRVPANEIVGLDPGELFVHRNIANLATPGDLNYLSVLQFSVEVLKVKHILVVGHYGCGGVRAALEDVDHGLMDNWIAPIRSLAREHQAELATYADPHCRHDRLTELNVLRQAQLVRETPVMTKAANAGEAPEVHAWCYSIRDGLIIDLSRRA